jgi:hypothetical protein
MWFQEAFNLPWTFLWIECAIRVWNRFPDVAATVYRLFHAESGCGMGIRDKNSEDLPLWSFWTVKIS